MKSLRLIHIVIAMLVWTAASAQIVVMRDQEKIDADSIRRDYDSRPYFGLYKDNYFTIGTSIGSKPSRTNSDVKFQISISQRLTKSVLPWHSYLYLFYSQKAMWNVFEESLPFHDLNFNPGIGWSKLIISKGRLVGKVSLILEHESNGRDGEASRSWNKISLSGAAFIDPNIMVHAKYWIPIIDGQGNKDILKYSGIYQAGIQGITNNKRWVFDLTFVKRKGWNLNGNIIANVGFRLFPNANQFLMLHYYNGYGENLLDYNKFHSRLRIGLLIRPNFFSDF
ncbi:MAG: phospholipase A [Muribaculaceae bacterium]|nr:phospholipase A [Muribaculaceae bacterium]